MTTKSRGVAFERLTRNAHQEEKFDWKELLSEFLGAIIVAGVIYFFSAVLLGLN